MSQAHELTGLAIDVASSAPHARITVYPDGGSSTRNELEQARKYSSRYLKNPKVTVLVAE